MGRGLSSTQKRILSFLDTWTITPGDAQPWLTGITRASRPKLRVAILGKAEWTRSDQAAVSRALRRLVERGLVERGLVVTRSAGTRTLAIVLTEDGRDEVLRERLERLGVSDVNPYRVVAPGRPRSP